MELTEYEKVILKRIYDNSLEILSDKSNSLVISSISSKKNSIAKCLINGAYHSSSDDPTIRTLELNDLIRCYKPGQYILTAKGAWFIEETYYGRTINDMISKIDDKSFALNTEKISEKNKVIVLSLISARCFSEKTSLEYSTEETRGAFMALLRNSFELLSELGIIDSSFESMCKTTTKNEISSFLNAIDKLPALTYQIFSRYGRNRYYLDVVENDVIQKEKVISLFRIIFEGDIPLEFVEVLSTFCNNMPLEYGYMFHGEGESFSGSDIDRIIEDCIYSASGM